MRIGLGQFNAVVGDISGNAEKMRLMYQQGLEKKVQLLVFPELSLSGYPPEDLLLKRHFLDDNKRALNKLAETCSKIPIVAGFAEGNGRSRYNSAALLRNGSITDIYRKTLLPNFGVFDEKRYFRPGNKPLVIQLNDLKFAFTICRDIWVIDWLTSFYKDFSFDVMINISASPYYLGKSAVRARLLDRCAKRFKCAAVYCNLVGGQDELVYDGRSFAVNSSGAVAARAKAYEEDLLVFDIVREKDNLNVSFEGAPNPQYHDTIDDLYHALVLGTRDYAWKNGFKKVLLGLSGGIDSSVVAAIAASALGKQNVTGITMPTRFNSPETISDAEKVAKNLGIEFLKIPIEPVLEGFGETLQTVDGWNKLGVAYENLQARIRGTILMSLSNQFAALVLTSGNKSETAVGYATLYGDTAGGFAVIKDVPKTMVYKLAEYINKISDREIIPQPVIRRPPTAELRENQKDTDSLPPYDLLDKILKGYVEQDKSPEELIDQGLDAEAVFRVIDMVDRNEYKRRQSPPGVKITTKAFGKDRRLPITNRYKSH
jgi:NAD+ synthase (glutamine-hydrolysing)